jgi:cytochrome c-type biogenesis protein CcmH/NrfG
LERLVETRKEYLPGSVDLATALTASKNAERAVEVLRPHIAAGVRNAPLWVAYADALAASRRAGEAATALQKAIEYTPDRSDRKKLRDRFKPLAAR